MALFGPSSGSGNKHLLEMKAGRMKIDESNNKVYSMKDKGLLYVHTGNDSLLHFCWQNRETKVVIQDLTIVPGEAQFKRIEHCTTGRVYVLYFANTKVKHLYWIQEPREDKEKELVEKLNHYLTSGANQNERRGGEMSELLSNLRNTDLPGMFSNMDPGLLEQILQGGIPGADGSGDNSFRQLMSGLSEQTSALAGRNTATSSQPQTRSQAAASNPSQRGNTDVPRITAPRSAQNLFSGSSSRHPNLGALVQQLQVSPGATAAARQAEAARIQPALISDVITVESMTDLVTDEEAMQPLYQLLGNSPEPIANVVTSPQFMQAVNIFSQGFLSRQLGPLMNEFGPEAVQAANNGDVLEFARALEARLKETTDNIDMIDPSDELD